MADNNGINGNEVQQAVSQALMEQKKKSRKKKVIIIAVILIILVIIIAAASLGGNDSKVETINNSQSSSSDNSSNTNSEIKQEKISVGQAITTDNLKISFISCNQDFKDYDEYFGPKSGNKLIRAEFTFENTSSSDKSLGSFECYADGSKCEDYYYADDYKSPTLETISAGRTLKSVVYYEVPQNAQSIELELEENIITSKKVVFVVK